MARTIDGRSERLGASIPLEGSLDETFQRQAHMRTLEEGAEDFNARTEQNSRRNKRNTWVVLGALAGLGGLGVIYNTLTQPWFCGQDRQGPYMESLTGARNYVSNNAFRTDRAQGICVTITGDILTLKQ